MRFKIPRPVLLFAVAVLLLNLIQATFTELIFDEAYYWYYAQDLAWGYFDHPPMVAWMIALGELFFNGELGVRFVSILLGAAIYLILWQLIGRSDKTNFIREFLVLVFSVILIHAYGFLSLPDTPLLFFTALFLLVYKHFLEKNTAKTAFFLGICMAALMYSKYHGGLVILFVLLSNLELFRNKYAWMALGVSLLLYSPHLWWLYDHDFVSIQYHISERPNRGYEFGDFTAGYFLNLVVLFGLTFPWVYRALWKTKSDNKFIKALLYITYGIIIFFFISSFQRRIQTQWMVAISIPLILLTFRFLSTDPPTRKWVYRMGLANIVVLLFLRVGLVYRPLFPIVFETHGNKAWVADLVKNTGGLPVVFENSYRNASMFQFYSGLPSFSMNNAMYRQNQYTIDNSEERIRNMRVAYIPWKAKNGDFYYTDPHGSKRYGNYIERFNSFRKLRTEIDQRPGQNETNSLKLVVFNPYNEEISIEALKFYMVYLNPYKQVEQIVEINNIVPDKEIPILRAKDSTYFEFQPPAYSGNEPVEYYKVSIGENGYLWGLNGNNQKIR